eukprot:1025261-Amphidinium_carterae.1
MGEKVDQNDFHLFHCKTTDSTRMCWGHRMCWFRCNERTPEQFPSPSMLFISCALALWVLFFSSGKLPQPCSLESPVYVSIATTWQVYDGVLLPTQLTIGGEPSSQKDRQPPQKADAQFTGGTSNAATPPNFTTTLRTGMLTS